MSYSKKSSILAPKKPRRGQKIAEKVPMQIIIEHVVICTFQVNAHAIHSAHRGVRADNQARQIAMYLAHVVCGLTLTEIGRLYRRDRTTVAHACHVIEDRRDDRQFDFVLELLESGIRILSRNRIALCPVIATP
jgi:chromosomal replication initiation ATPase DnaA